MTNAGIMTLSKHEYETIMADTSKRIEEHISWKISSAHNHAQEFRQNVLSDLEWPLFVNGRWNPWSHKLSYTLILRTTGRILGLDLGDCAHHNPTCQSITGAHLHRWNEKTRDKIAFQVSNIGNWYQTLEVWEQFCSLAVIAHRGKMTRPILQERLFR